MPIQDSLLDTIPVRTVGIPQTDGAVMVVVILLALLVLVLIYAMGVVKWVMD